MDANDVTTPSPSSVAPLGGRTAAVVLLSVGPALCVWLAAARVGVWFPAAQLPMVAAVVLVFWSPLPFSVPALVLQDARDAALPEQRWVDRLTRPVRLVPHLVCSPASPVRVEMVASLAGFAGGVATAAAALT